MRIADVLRVKRTQVVTIQTPVEEVMRIMTEHRVRHAPVVADGGLRGIVSIGDVVKNRIDELETERAALTDYITGTRYM
jgi:CBS domain-containing protein